MDPIQRQTVNKYTNPLQVIEQKNGKRIIPTQKAEFYSKKKVAAKHR
jgi:hypothetical protein